VATSKQPTGWKVIALALVGATIFWFFSALGKNYNYRISHPIKFVFDRDSLISINNLPNSVDLEVEGGGWDLFRNSFWFGADPVYFFLENPKSTSSIDRDEIFRVFSDQLERFQIKYIVTDSLFLDIDVRKTKVIVPKLDTSKINLANNYKIISEIKILPDSVRIYGPDSFIDTLGSELVFSLSNLDIDESFDRFVSLNLPDKRGIYSDPEAVNVKFEVDRFDRLSIPLKLELLNFPEDSSAYLEQLDSKVSFTIQKSLKGEYSEDDFKIIVDYNLMNKKDSLTPAILVFYPENITEITAEPDTFKVKYNVQ